MYVSDKEASNALYNGQAESFEQAVQWHIKALQHELANSHHIDRQYNQPEDTEFIQSFEGYIETARKVLAEYRTAHEEMCKVLAAKWAEDADLEQFADALTSGDYALLAV